MKKLKIFLLYIVCILCLIQTGCENDPGQQLEQESFLDQKQVMDEKGIVSYLPNEYIEEDSQQDIYNFQEQLLIANYYVDEQNSGNRFALKLIDLKTGELKKKYIFHNVQTYPTLQLIDDCIVVSDGIAGKITILDESLKIIKEYEASGEAVFLDKKMEKAFCLNQEKGIEVKDLAKGTSEIWLEESGGVYVSKACDYYVTLSFSNLKTEHVEYALLDLEESRVEVLDFGAPLYGVEHNSRIWLAGLLGETDTYMVGAIEDPQVVQMEAGAMVSLIPNSDQILSTVYLPQNALKVDLYGSDGSYLSGTVLTDEAVGFWGNIVWFESLNGYLFTSTDEDKGDKLFYWDKSVEVEGRNLEFFRLENGTHIEHPVTEEHYEKAERISKQYGVTVKIGDDCETEYSDYTVEKNMNGERIDRGLDVLERGLMAYPEGFIEQLFYDNYKELEINLMGGIKSKEKVTDNSGGFDSFIAFVEHRQGKYVMIFDLSRGQLIEQDLYHEISHLVDRKLQHKVDRGEDVIYSEEKWDSFNPIEFSYTYSYYNVPSSYYQDGYDDYFVDVYSRTFPTEDRARILEYAMIGADFCFSTYPGLRDKLNYYCEAIRDGFDTTGWPERTKWEEMLPR